MRRANAEVECALLNLARCQNSIAAAVGGKAIFLVQAQVGFALILVGSMAGGAIVGQNRPNIAVEFHSRRERCFRASGAGLQCEQGKCPGLPTDSVNSVPGQSASRS